MKILDDTFRPLPAEYIPGLSFHKYADHPGVNSGTLRKQTAFEMFHSIMGVDPDEESPKTHFALGDAAHKALLEPDLFDGSDKIEQYFQYSPTKGLDTKAAQAAFAADPTRPLVTQEIIDTAQKIRDAAMKHHMIRRIVKEIPSEKELTGVAWDPEFQVLRKTRVDLRPVGPNNFLFDFKSTRKGLSIRQVYYECLNFGYGLQAAYYMDTDRLITGEKRPIFLLAFITSSAPYMARLFELNFDFTSESLLHQGRELYRERMGVFTAAAGEYRRRLAEKHANPLGAWEAYENESEPKLLIIEH